METQHRRAASMRRLTSVVDSRPVSSTGQALRGNDGLKVVHYPAFRVGRDELAAAPALGTIWLVAGIAAVIGMVQSS